jgi:hypothetical protein
MKHILTLAIAGAIATSAYAADSKDDVIAAAKKLGAQSYSWTTTVKSEGAQGGGRFAPGPIEGKADKDGVVCVTTKRGDNTTEAILKGEKGAVKTEEGWKTFEELRPAGGGGGGGQGQRNPGMFMAMMFRNFKAPADQAADLAAKVKEFKSQDGACVGDLTEDGAKALLVPQRRGGNQSQNAPEVSGAKGSAKFWTKDGVLCKYEIKVQGKVTRQNGEVEIDRTTTVEIKDVGTTKFEVPADAKKAL